MIDPACDGRGTEAVIDMHNRNARGATIEHAEQRREPAEACAVADAGWYGDHRNFHQSADHARKRTFHPGDDDDDTCGVQSRLLGQKAMNAGYANVE